MKNKVVLITGADWDWPGFRICLCAEGARIVISGRHEEEGQKRKLNLFGPMCATRRCAQLVDKTVARFGRLDVAVMPQAPKASPAL